jgi:hypothetical protein
MLATQEASVDSVEVTSRTWAHSSHDLFDFEATEAKVSSRNFDITSAESSAMFYRDKENDVAMTDDGNSAGNEVLATLSRRRGQFFIDRTRRIHGDEVPDQKSHRLWLVVRSLESSVTGLGEDSSQASSAGHVLQEEDVFKLGRSRFQVRQIVTKADPNATFQLDETSSSCHACRPETIGVDGDKPVCRICLMEGVEDDDVFLQPCGCKGSVQSVHMSCLKYWIGSRMNTGRPDGTFFYQPLACELCKVDYPYRVRMECGELKDLQELPKPEPPFIVLANRSVRKDRGLHFLSLADGKTLKLGRSHDCHVRINDVSISRCQATIRYEHGRLILEDNKSKFGTLVMLRKPCSLQPGRTTTIQAGRTIISFTAKEKTVCESLSQPDAHPLPSDAEGESDAVGACADIAACAPYEGAVVGAETVVSPCSSS